MCWNASEPVTVVSLQGVNDPELRKRDSTDHGGVLVRAAHERSELPLVPGEELFEGEPRVGWRDGAQAELPQDELLLLDGADGGGEIAQPLQRLGQPAVALRPPRRRPRRGSSAPRSTMSRSRRWWGAALDPGLEDCRWNVFADRLSTFPQRRAPHESNPRNDA